MFNAMYVTIGSVCLALVIGAVTIHSLSVEAKPGGRAPHWFRFSLAAVFGWLAVTAPLAVPVQHMSAGLSVGLAVRAAWYVFGLNRYGGAFNGVVDLVPVLAAGIMIWPYWSMLLYFMGFDAVVLVITLVILAAGTYAATSKEGTFLRAAKAVQGLGAVIMLLWMAAAPYIERV